MPLLQARVAVVLMFANERTELLNGLTLVAWFLRLSMTLPRDHSKRVIFHFHFSRNTSCQTQMPLQVPRTQKLRPITEPVPSTTRKPHRAMTIARLTTQRPALKVPCLAAKQQAKSQSLHVDVLPNSIDNKDGPRRRHRGETTFLGTNLRTVGLSGLT